MGVKGETANNTQDSLTFEATNKWIKMAAVGDNVIKFGHELSPLNKRILNPSNTTVTKFGDSFNLLNFAVDEAGHITGCNEDEITITLPTGSLDDAISNEADVITQLAFDGPTGHLSTTRTNVGALKLTGYELPTQITNNGVLSANATINDNFGRLEFRLNQEVNDRENAIAKEVNDRNTAIASAISAIVDKNDDGTINKLAEVIEWINNNPSTATEMQVAIQNNAATISTATGDIASLNNTISQLLNTINDLTTRIENLENPPQEPEQGETGEE